MKRWKGIVMGGLFLGALGITAHGLSERPPPPVEAQVAEVRRGRITRTITGTGKVQAATTVKLSSNLSGDLTQLLVAEGNRVVKGQVLGRIDRHRVEASARQARAARSAARSDMRVALVEVERSSADFTRVERLATKGLVSRAELDNARAARDSAVARHAVAQQRLAQASAADDEARSDLSKTTLVAPIDGTIIELSREVGERVRGSDFSEDVVMVLAALNSMEVRFEVGEHEVVHLRPGLTAEVTLDALEGERYPGVVVETAQRAIIKNPGTEAEVTSFPITVALENRPPRVLPGMSAEVRISAETREDAVLVPIQAVTVRPEKSLPDAPLPGQGPGLGGSGEPLAKVVFVVDADDKVRMRRVRTGIASDMDLEILEGLQEGMRVVEGPYRTLAKELQHEAVVRELPPGGPRPGQDGRRS